MPRTSLIIALLIFCSGAARATEPCGDRLLAFNTYEVMGEEKIETRFSVFPLPDWSDASAFKGVVSKSADATLEVELEGKKKDFVFETWDKDPSLFAAAGFRANKFFKNSESGAFFTLRLKENGRIVCEERREIFGD